MTNQDSPAEMSLFEHLGELRQRLLYSLIAVICTTIASCYFAGDLFQIFSQPFDSAFDRTNLIGTGPAEAFMLKIHLAVCAGILLASPIIFYQVWLFIAPALYPTERRYVIPFVITTTFFFLAGAYFCFRVVLPFAFEFFASEYRSLSVTPNIKISEQLSVVIWSMVGFGAVFELPTLAFILARLGLIDHRMLLDGGRYAIVAIFIVSAILTPPDVVTQFLMAGPLLLLYGLSILVVRWVERSRSREEPPAPPNTPAG